jgi:hypothetical protein
MQAPRGPFWERCRLELLCVCVSDAKDNTARSCVLGRLGVAAGSKMAQESS